jgi:hypothetical protein
MAFARNAADHFLRVRQTNAGNLAQGRVRLLRRRGLDARCRRHASAASSAVPAPLCSRPSGAAVCGSGWLIVGIFWRFASVFWSSHHDGRQQLKALAGGPCPSPRGAWSDLPEERPDRPGHRTFKPELINPKRRTKALPPAVECGRLCTRATIFRSTPIYLL